MRMWQAAKTNLRTFCCIVIEDGQGNQKITKISNLQENLSGVGFDPSTPIPRPRT